MKRMLLLAAAVAIASAPPVSAQSRGRVTFIQTTRIETQSLAGMSGYPLAVQVRDMLNKGLLTAYAMPLVVDGNNHEKRMELGGRPSTFVDTRRMTVTTTSTLQRDVVLSYGPARSGGLGVHAELVDTVNTATVGGGVVNAPGSSSEITGIVPLDGQPQAVLSEIPAQGIVPAKVLIILVEP